VHYIKDVGPLMLSVGFLDDLAYLGAPSHTSYTLDVGMMSLGIADIANCTI
jgi:hypothetical protein